MAVGLRWAWLRTATITRAVTRGPPLDRPSACESEPASARSARSGALDVLGDVLGGASGVPYKHVEEHPEGESSSLLPFQSSPFYSSPSDSFLFSLFFFLPPSHSSTPPLLPSPSISFDLYFLLSFHSSVSSRLPSPCLSPRSLRPFFIAKCNRQTLPLSPSFLHPFFPLHPFFLHSPFFLLCPSFLNSFHPSSPLPLSLVSD